VSVMLCVCLCVPLCVCLCVFVFVSAASRRWSCDVGVCKNVSGRRDMGVADGGLPAGLAQTHGRETAGTCTFLVAISSRPALANTPHLSRRIRWLANVIGGLVEPQRHFTCDADTTIDYFVRPRRGRTVSPIVGKHRSLRGNRRSRVRGGRDKAAELGKLQYLWAERPNRQPGDEIAGGQNSTAPQHTLGTATKSGQL
jgi:hypothetical protein